VNNSLEKLSAEISGMSSEEDGKRNLNYRYHLYATFSALCGIDRPGFRLRLTCCFRPRGDPAQPPPMDGISGQLRPEAATRGNVSEMWAHPRVK
jgi:hypothetical protein